MEWDYDWLEHHDPSYPMDEEDNYDEFKSNKPDYFISDDDLEIDY